MMTNRCCRLDTLLSTSIGLFLTTGFTCPNSNPIGAALTTLGIYGIVTSLGVACIPKQIFSSKTRLCIAAGGLMAAFSSAQLPPQLDPRLRVVSFFALGIAPALAAIKSIPFSSLRSTHLTQITVISGG